ncbi:hypothetical protein AB0M57_29880 [Streptomyces sp. NPDC051597]
MAVATIRNRTSGPYLWHAEQPPHIARIAAAEDAGPARVAVPGRRAR